MVYTSSTSSLAILETLVHVDRQDLPDDLRLLSILVPNDLERDEVELSQLSTSWSGYPAPSDLADLGTDWLRAGKSAVLVVPSAVNPLEFNVLINPLHQDSALIASLEDVEFSLDSRFF